MSEYDIVLKKKSPAGALGLTVAGVALAVLGSTKLIAKTVFFITAADKVPGEPLFIFENVYFTKKSLLYLFIIFYICVII